MKSKLTKYLSTVLMCSTLLSGCVGMFKPSGDLNIRKKHPEIVVKKDDNETTISIQEDINFKGIDGRFFDKDPLDFEFTIEYSPVRIKFKNYEDVDGIPHPLTGNSKQIKGGIYKRSNSLDEDLYYKKDKEEFGLPFIINNKQRVNENTLDMLVASNQVECLKEYSLGNINVEFFSENCFERKNLRVYDEINGFNAFFIGGDVSFYDTEINKGSPYNSKRISCDENYKIRTSDLKAIVGDAEEIKRLADELLWQISITESIDELFYHINNYEESEGTQVTHFAVIPQYDYGIGQTMGIGTSIYSGFLSTSLEASGNSSERFNIHLSGIIATNQGIKRK